MESPQVPGKPLSTRRASSLDRLQESLDGQRPSTHSAPSKRGLRRTVSDGAPCSQSLAQSPEGRGTSAAALGLEETQKFIPSEQKSARDTKKDKAHRRTQSGWLKTLLNFFLRTSPEEPKEKASKRPKGRENLSQPAASPGTPRTPGEPVIRKKSHEKKVSRRKAKKHAAEESKGTQGQEVSGQEAQVAASDPEFMDLGQAHRGWEDPDLQESLFIEGGSAGVVDESSQATGHGRGGDQQPDKDAIIQMIVEFLQKVGDDWEKQRLQALQPGLAVQTPAPAAVRKKSSERKASFRRPFAHKKHDPEARPPKRPSFLPLCVGGHRPSTSSSTDLEDPQGPETLSTDLKDPSLSELSVGAGQGPDLGPEEELQRDRASESNEFFQRIIALLEEPGLEKRLQTPQSEVAVESLSPAARKKSPEKKSTFRRAFSHKKHGYKEPKRAGATDVSSPEARPPKRPSFLPLCVGGHRPSISGSLDSGDADLRKPSSAEGGPVGCLDSPSQSRSHKPEGEPQLDGESEPRELIIQELVALLQALDGQLGKQIRRHPSFKRFLYKLSDSSLRKLAATLQSQAAHSAEPSRNLDERRYQFAASLVNVFAGNNSHAVRSLMGLRRPYSRHVYAQFPYKEAQQNITSPDVQSPD
ncbi:protein BNIP5 [Echinops telfairi]|uniref:Protein BNIP5 n=1 Tax=Echinops telfairi TaxID=9371 RepID=A0AC55DG52_ECHTE|nr:protein BNIP5 [Echinops telfairi]